MINIIVVLYKNFKQTQNLIISIYKNSPSFKLTFVDNNKKQNKIYKRYTSVYIKNKKNVGFAKAANQGAKIAKGEYLLFLNPDTEVTSESIQMIIEFVKSKKDAGVVGCKTLNPDGSLQPSCGNFPTISKIVLDRIPILNKIFSTELIRNEKYYEKEQTPDWISGAFFLVKKSVFEKLGGFDEKYFLYVEDVDFCYRAKKTGHKVYYTPTTSIIHFDQGRSKERKKFKALQMRKGFSIFFQKHKSLLYCKAWETILFIEKMFNPYLKHS